MATVALSTSSVTLDPGTAYELTVLNSGAVACHVQIAGGLGYDERLRPGQQTVVHPNGQAVTAYVRSDTGQVTTTTSTNPETASSGGGSFLTTSAASTTYVPARIFTPSDNTTDQKTALNAALASGAKRVHVAFSGTGVVIVSVGVLIPSNVTLELAPGVTLRRLAGSKGNLIVNNAAVNGGRDSNVALIGLPGSAIDGADNSSAGTTNLHHLFFRHVDGLTVRGFAMTTSAGKYAINLGDCTRYDVSDIFCATSSDGVHVNGPATRGSIRRISGAAGDDLVAFTSVDYVAYNDTQGDITETTVEDIHGIATSTAILKIVAGPATSITGFKLSGLYGSTTAAYAIAIGDSAIGSTCTDLEADFSKVYATSTNYLLSIGAETGARRISLSDFDWIVGPSVVGNVVQVGAGSVGQIAVSGGATKTVGNVNLVHVSGTVTHLLIDQVTMTFTDATAGRIVAMDGSGSITNIEVSNVTQVNGVHGFWLAVAAASGRLKISNATFVGTSKIVQCYATAGYDVSLLNVSCTTSSKIVSVVTTGTVVIRGHNIDYGSAAGVENFSGTGTLSSKSMGFPCDLAVINSKTKGDMAYNTNAALSCGAGPVVYTGTAWKSLIDGTTY